MTNSQSKSCDICKTKSSSIPNFIRHCKSKTHFKKELLQIEETITILSNSSKNKTTIKEEMDKLIEKKKDIERRRDDQMTTCEICNCEYMKASEKEHFASTMHMENINPLICDEEYEKDQDDNFNCTLCNFSADKIQRMRMHMNSKSHMDTKIINEKKYNNTIFCIVCQKEIIINEFLVHLSKKSHIKHFEKEKIIIITMIE